MAVNLSKGARVNLSKESNGLNTIRIGLGWDPVTAKRKDNAKKGLLGKLVQAIVGEEPSYSGANIDCDAWVLLLGGNSLGSRGNRLAWYGNKDIRHNGNLIVKHHGDNLTGDGDGDDEVITIYLDRLPSDVNEIVVGVTIFSARSRNQDFSKIDNVFTRVVDDRYNSEIARFTSKDMSGASDEVTFIAGKLYKDADDWHFEAMGKLTQDTDINTAAKKFE